MGKLLEKAARPENIYNAWKRFRRDRALWEPGVSKQEMEDRTELYLMKLAEELRTHAYLPNPVRFFTVQKGDGRKRIISANMLRDKVAQRAVLNIIEPLGEQIFHPDSYGYRPMRSIEMAVSRAREYILCGFGWVVDADIQACFDNISHKALIRMLNSLISDDEMVALIRRWLDVGAVRKGFLSSAKGIPQGAVLSPFLCNVYLTPWDNKMSAHNVPFIRYADDFILFAGSRKIAEKSLMFTEKTLNRWGLSLNMKKTLVANAGPKIRFLGRKLPKID